MTDRQLLLDLSTAMTDWLHQFAHEMCEAKRVEESAKRVWDAGGTLAYIASLQRRIKDAMARPEVVPSDAQIAQLARQYRHSAKLLDDNEQSDGSLPDYEKLLDANVAHWKEFIDAVDASNMNSGQSTPDAAGDDAK